MLCTVIALLTGGACIADHIDTNRKIDKQKYESIPTIIRRQQTFTDTRTLLSKDYAPHLKKATPEWKKRRCQ